MGFFGDDTPLHNVMRPTSDPHIGWWLVLFEKSPDRKIAFGLAVLLEHSIQFMEQIHGREKSSSISSSYETQTFPGVVESLMTYEAPSQRDIPFNSCGELTPQMQESSERDARIWGCQRKHIIKYMSVFGILFWFRKILN